MGSKILFISHDSSRSGAPNVLLFFLRWLKDHSDTQFDVLLLKDGPLRKEFELLTATYLVDDILKEYSIKNRVKRRIFRKYPTADSRIEDTAKALQKNNTYNVVYGNSIVSLPWIIKFGLSGKTKTICAIHELPFIIESYFTEAYIIANLPKLDLIIAGSNVVAENLRSRYHIAKTRIEVVHAFIDTNIDFVKSKEALRRELNIKEGDLIIGGAGYPELRKGTELLAALALQLKTINPAMAFKLVWLGGEQTNPIIRQVKLDAQKLGVESNIVFAEHTDNPNDYINLYDIFILLSREDPFPIVVITAAYLQKAIVAFEKSGGAVELLSDGAGFLVPYLDIDKVAAVIEDLYRNQNEISRVGAIAKRKVADNYSAATIPFKTFSLIQELQKV